MALDNTAAGEAIDAWILTMTPPPADGGVALKAAMQPLVKAIYDKIVEHAEITIVIAPPSGAIA